MHLVRTAAVLALMLCPSSAWAGYAVFDQHTDTILVNGHTTLGTATTYEAVVRPGAVADPGGKIWSELTSFQEDKAFGLENDGGLFVYSHAVAPPFIEGGSSTAGAWHHYAYVYDGAQERLYVDGALVASRAASGDILDSSLGAGMAIGQQQREGSTFHAGFIGDVDSLRVSTVARYAGSSFVAPTGDFTSDASTAVLFNFNEAPGTTTITDEAGGFVGVLGANGTSPEFIPEPAATVGFAVVAAAALARRRRAATR